MPHSELHQRQRAKNIALFWGLLALGALFFVITIVKLSSSS